MTVQQIKQRFGIIGNSKEINNAVEIAMQVAPTEVTVLVNGENGAGKDVFSQIIHQFSKRKHSPFIAINCGAIPEGTLDSELFGHERGSFTSAYETRKGYFEEVEDGTIFLDEIAEMPLATQARLLRLLENGEYLRVGSSKVKKANVRVIAATNKNLVELIRQGKFREDLYFRLNTVTIQVPPLRDRGTDIPFLFSYFALEFSEKYKREPLNLTFEAAEILTQYRWPGNVRELRNLAEKLTVLIKGDEVNADDLRKHLLVSSNYLPVLAPMRAMDEDEVGHRAETRRELDHLYDLILKMGQEVREIKQVLQNGNTPPVFDQPYDISAGMQPLRGSDRYDDYVSGYDDDRTFQRPVEDVHLLEESLSIEKHEKDLIQRALDKYENNRRKAADALGISERTLYRKIKSYDINA
ncbi:MAG: sigma-54 interaction domain-containing protein [Bacteroidia bacterium]